MLLLSIDIIHKNFCHEIKLNDGLIKGMILIIEINLKRKKKRADEEKSQTTDSITEMSIRNV